MLFSRPHGSQHWAWGLGWVVLHAGLGLPDDSDICIRPPAIRWAARARIAGACRRRIFFLRFVGVKHTCVGAILSQQAVGRQTGAARVRGGQPHFGLKAQQTCTYGVRVRCTVIQPATAAAAARSIAIIVDNINNNKPPGLTERVFHRYCRNLNPPGPLAGD